MSRALRRWPALALAVALTVSPLTGLVRPGSALGQTASPSVPAPTCVAEAEPNEQPEQSPALASAICLTGRLPELRDQDLVLWEVQPAEALITWRFTIEGIPTTITSLYLFVVQSEPGVVPVDARQVFRVDSDATSPTPGVREGVSLKAGRYLLGISRGDPVGGVAAPVAEYRALIEREAPLPDIGDVEPNDDAAVATPVSGAFALVGDAQGTPDVYRWTLTDADAARRWQVDLRAVEADYVELALQRADGTTIATTSVPRTGTGHLYDLSLAAGDYLLRFSPGSDDVPLPYVVSAAPTDAADADPEPNDDPSQALAVPLGEERAGRLAGPRDRDWYAFTIPDGQADQVDVGIRVDSDADRQVCLMRASGEPIVCRAGTGDVVLSNLLLAPGDYQVQVDGDEDLADRYRLGVSAVGPVAEDREVEPNDDPRTAAPFAPDVTMRGRSANGDVDWFRVTVTGEPQVWRLDATGSGLRSVRWQEPDQEVRGTADITPDGRRASLWDLALVPGDHWIVVESRGEDYALTLTPLGPRAAGTEREPNNEGANAEPIAFDTERTGRLPGAADTDVIRFSTSVREHVTITLTPPADAGIRLLLRSGDLELTRVREPVPGRPIRWEGELPPGEQELELSSVDGSVDPYTLLVTREDPFTAPADLEPNDTRATARPLPSSLTAEGSGFGLEGEDDDWYRLPPLVAEAAVTFRLSDGAVLQELHDGTSGVRVDRVEPGLWQTAPLPAGTTLAVSVSGPGAYALSVDSDGLDPADPVAPLPLTAELSTATPEIAAYLRVGQVVDATLRLANDGALPLTLGLAARTEHHAWTAEPTATEVTVPAGGTLDVPVTLRVGADAWADRPVRTWMRITDVADPDRALTTFLDVTPRRDQPAVSPALAWTVPDALLGGLDVASLVLGASVPAPLNRSEAELHDGVAMTGIGFSATLGGEALALTVDLAGDLPVPVAGVIINPLAGPAALVTSPRSVEVQLSDDGTAWTPVLSAELSPLGRDQAFALPSPVPARFARLVVASTWGGPTGGVWMGEWQVIADPAWTPPAPFNVADPQLGGHLVWMDPGADDPRQPELMLTETVDPDPWSPYLQGGTVVSWALGFADDRTAQLTGLEWEDGPGSDPARRFERVEVALSTEGALGPWEPAGTWDLTRGADGAVPPFTFATPTWARFVRLTGDGPATTDYREMPVVLRALERPVGEDYRSILGAWGRGTPAAIRELLVPGDLAALALPDEAADGDDTPETATVLPIATPIDGRVRRGEDVDWYRVTVPADQNVLTLTLEAPAEAGIVPTLEDATGARVELAGVTGGGRASWVADVEPGATYLVRLEQPPVSTVFTYDTSGSMGRYVSYVSAALRGFAADIQRGQESVLVMPFEDPPLLDDWSDDAYAIEAAVAGVASVSGSSAAEASLIAALRELAARPGAKAILLVTDAETQSYAQGGELWRYLDDVRPVIFAVHVEGSGAPALTTDLMQDWAASNGGHYEYAVSHGEVDRALDRLATWMRRPASYRLTASVAFVDRTPGRLRVSPPAGSDGAGSVVAGTDVAVAILFDTSGSMLAKLTPRLRRIDVAKTVLDRLVTRTLPPGVPTSLRIFRPGKQSCDTQQLTPLSPLDPAAMAAQVKGLRIHKGTKTPLGAILTAAVGDLGGATGTAIVVLITDGQESCGGDPEAAVRALVATGLDVRVNIVGFDIDDEGLRAQLETWAQVGNGQSFDADSADALADGLAQALAAPFRVLDADGAVVATGTVGSDEVVLPPGTYRVEVLTDPAIVFEEVVILPGQARDLVLEPPAP